MRKRREPIPKDWYRTKEAVFLFAVLGLFALALAAGIAWLIVRHPHAALIAAGCVFAAAAAGYGIFRAVNALKWKRDMARLDKAADALARMEKAGREGGGRINHGP